MYLLHYFAIFYTSIVALLFSQIAILAILGWLKKLLRQRAILSQYDKLYSDYQKAYDGLVDYADKAHCRAKHSKNEFANHINSIEILKVMQNINFLNLKALKKRIFYFILKNVFCLQLRAQQSRVQYNTKTTQENLYHKLFKLTKRESV